MEHTSHPVESHWRTSLLNRIIQASSLLEVLLSGLVLIGLLLSVVPLIRWMPGLLFDGNEAEIRTFLERSLDIVIGIEFINQLFKCRLGRIAGQGILKGEDADLLAGAMLIGDINLRRGVFTHYNDGQAGRSLAICLSRFHLMCDLLANQSGNGFAIDKLGGHRVSPGSVMTAVRPSRLTA